MWHWGSKVFNHETGHALGLPDLYGYQGDLHRFAGGWDLMGRYTDTLVPVSVRGGRKGVVIRTSPTTVLVKDARPGSGGCEGHELNDAPFDVGSRFRDAASNTTIDVIGRSGDDYRINIAFGVAP
ncbi:hypothetical protein ACQPZF_12240 [Actinosynnema sp. CS-041913]|uniref:hypothetical protein n=1 Tax=Actinosynnema sp. CS-041913 TaxID=3239917 RepID=UPI003D9329E8